MSREHSWPPGVAHSVKRMCRQSNGFAKRRWTRAEAQAKARASGRDAYVCPVCGWWHTGTIKGES